MKEIRVVSETQVIEVNPTDQSVSITNAGPIGPPGPEGPQGDVGPVGPAGVHVGTTPPTDTTVLWYDTN